MSRSRPDPYWPFCLGVRAVRHGWAWIAKTSGRTQRLSLGHGIQSRPWSMHSMHEWVDLLQEERNCELVQTLEINKTVHYPWLSILIDCLHYVQLRRWQNNPQLQEIACSLLHHELMTSLDMTPRSWKRLMPNFRYCISSSRVGLWSETQAAVCVYVNARHVYNHKFTYGKLKQVESLYMFVFNWIKWQMVLRYI
jgi:hypothetical protein